MIVSSQLFEAYLECSTKCWLRSRNEPTAGNAYAEWARAQNEAYYEGGLKRMLAMFPEGARTIAFPISKHAKEASWRLAFDVRLRTNVLEARLQATTDYLLRRRRCPPCADFVAKVFWSSSNARKVRK